MKELASKYDECEYFALIDGAEKRALIAVGELEKKYPDSQCALEYKEDPFRLLVMARLSAQCTDKRVNEVSVPLFRRFPDAFSMADAPLPELEELVRPCGVYRVKAKNIKDMSAMLVKDHGGKVPRDRDYLLTLPGVGRKIANLIMGDVFGDPGIVADTHCIRFANRMGVCHSDSPLTVETVLDGLIPPEKQSDFCHRAVQFGRDVCTSRNPDCDGCPIRKAILERNR